MEFTTGLPCTHFSPASITVHLDESIINGARAMSGSEAMRFRNRAMAASPSSMASSMLTSMICAPLLTCWRATSSALSYSLLRTSFLNTAEPVTLVRSPTFTNTESAPTFNGSMPARRNCGSITGRSRGLMPVTASAMALMCAGLVPQHPPTILRNALCAHSLICTAMDSGVSS